jgi:hypothetical protein
MSHTVHGPTLYERAAVRSYVSLSAVQRGADVVTLPDPTALGELTGALARGLAGEDAAGLPMGLLARHGLTRAALAEALPGALLRDWAEALREALPAAAPGAALPTQARLRFDRRRLGRLAAAGDRFDPGSAPMLLLPAWRAGRAARTH